MRAFLRNWLLAFLVPRPLIGIFFLPRYFRHWREYRKLSSGNPLAWRDAYPCLGDWVTATPFDAHYFHQGAWLARQLGHKKPPLHVDIGSSVLTMSVISAVTETVFLDYRPLQVRITNLHSVSGSITSLPFGDKGISSLSSLHVIEHIGLGRYGDPIDPQGSVKAAIELARVLAPGGRLYVSTPVGRERVCFNGHRVFHPNTVADMFKPLSLESFSVVDDAGALNRDISTSQAADLEYGCGLFVFVRNS